MSDDLLTPSISIHALREESDPLPRRPTRRMGISIHALREESDFSFRRSLIYVITFQSTLSVRRATSVAEALERSLKFQSTLSVRRATLAFPRSDVHPKISIHALREESDPSKRDLILAHCRFQSTLSVRRATGAVVSQLFNAAKFQSTLSVRRATVQLDIFCPLFETQASCLALSIANNTAGMTNNIPKTSNWLSVSF